MKIRPITLTLKDNTEVTIRTANVNDAPGLLKCIRTYIADNPYMAIEPDEFMLSLHQGREWIQDFSEAENSLLLVAEHDETIVGNLDITGAKRIRLRHNGLIGMGMTADYRSKGLGAALIQAGIDWARTTNILERLWLQVLADNTPAIALYRKMGFEQEGLQKNFIQKSPGVYTDNLIMGMALKN